MKIVIDTNIFLSAILKSKENVPRKIIRYCLEGKLEPLMGQTLFCEYEDVLSRKELVDKSTLSISEIGELFDAV